MSGEAPPSWFAVMQAAKWMGVAPWELAEKAWYWTEWAQACIWVENEVNDQRRRHNDSRSKGGGKGKSPKQIGARKRK